VTAWSHDDKLELEKQYIQELRPVFHRRALFSDTTGEYVIPAEPKPFEKIKIRFRTAKDNVDYVYVIINKKR
jgi:alpha-glucosidase